MSKNASQNKKVTSQNHARRGGKAVAVFLREKTDSDKLVFCLHIVYLCLALLNGLVGVHYLNEPCERPLAEWCFVNWLSGLPFCTVILASFLFRPYYSRVSYPSWGCVYLFTKVMAFASSLLSIFVLIWLFSRYDIPCNVLVNNIAEPQRGRYTTIKRTFYILSTYAGTLWCFSSTLQMQWRARTIYFIGHLHT
jgi:hypothetical protein